jgi:hypothetical protein
MNTNNDNLLRSFNSAHVNLFDLKTIHGGASNGYSSDPDGCTASWFDLCGGGYHHTEDHVTCD